MGVYERFAEYYDLIYQPPAAYESECDLLERIFERLRGKTTRRILDIGCGTGTHAVILSRRGYNVTGIDISTAMIERAESKAEKANVAARFSVQDMRNLELNQVFDCVICMFGGFGYVLKQEDLVGLFSGLNHHLSGGGLFIFEFWNIGGLKPSPHKSWTKTQNGNVDLYRLSESNFDLQTNILNVDMHFIVIRTDRTSETFTERHRIRCYTLAEMQERLENNGFHLLSAYDWEGGYKAEFRTPRKETFRILAVSERKP